VGGGRGHAGPGRGNARPLTQGRQQETIRCTVSTLAAGQPRRHLLPAALFRAGSESLPHFSLADWAGRSALGFGHARRDLAAGDLGGADAEGGPDVDRVDLFFGRPEAGALRENLG
jgi:hypothetical protein